MSRLRPGWLVVASAAVLLVSGFCPWLVAGAGNRASAIGGMVGTVPGLPAGFGVGQLIVLLASTLIIAGAMAAQRLFARIASSTALTISVLLGVMIAWYYRLYVYPPVTVTWGFYLGATMAAIAVVLSVWTMVAAWSSAAAERTQEAPPSTPVA